MSTDARSRRWLQQARDRLPRDHPMAARISEAIARGLSPCEFLVEEYRAFTPDEQEKFRQAIGGVPDA